MFPKSIGKKKIFYGFLTNVLQSSPWKVPEVLYSSLQFKYSVTNWLADTSSHRPILPSPQLLQSSQSPLLTLCPIPVSSPSPRGSRRYAEHMASNMCVGVDSLPSSTCWVSSLLSHPHCPRFHHSPYLLLLGPIASALRAPGRETSRGGGLFRKSLQISDLKKKKKKRWASKI